MRRYLFAVIDFMLLIGLVIPALGATPLKGSRAAAGYAGLNLMFIIDQSGSMGGTRYSGDPIYGPGSDIQDLRFFAPQYTIDWLSSLLNALPEDARPDINLSMVAFGTTARPILQWVNIEEGYLKAADAQKSQLLTDISNQRFYNSAEDRYTNLGFTNFREAFKEANTLFNDAPRSTDVGRPYLSAVIVLTDGAPCITNSNGECNDLTPNGAPAGHLRNLLEYVQSNYPNTELFVVGMDTANEYFLSLEPYWKDIVCANLAVGVPCDSLRLRQVYNESETGVQFNDVLSYLFNTVSGADLSSIVLTPPDTFFVPPYSQLLRIGIFKSRPEALGAAVVLTKPDGTSPTSSEITEIGVNTLIEAREVSLPQSGDWKIDVTDVSRVETINYRANIINALAEMSIDGNIYEKVGAGGGVLTPSLELNAYESVPLQLRVVSSTNGAALIEDPAYPLTVTAQLYDATQPDPALRLSIGAPIPLQRDPNFAGTTVFSGAWIPVDGKYEIRVNATYNHAGTTEYLLRDLSVYDGVRVGGVDFQSLGLASTSYLQGETITFASSVTDHDTGVPVTRNLAGLETQATITDSAGNLIPHDAIPNAATNPGEVLAHLALDTPGQYTITTQITYRDETGTLQPVKALPATFNITIRPLQQLAVSVSLNPSASSVDAHHFGLSLSPPFVGVVNSLLITVQVKNEYTGQPVSLASVSNGTVIHPDLMLRQGDTIQDLSDKLVEGQAGVYTLELDDLGMGDYSITAIANVPEDQLGADLTWRSSTASIQQNRKLAPFFYLLGAGLVAMALVTLGSAATVRQAIIYRGNLPKMQGNVLILYMELGGDLKEADTLRTWDMTGKHKFTVKGREASPFSLIRFIAPDKKQSLNGVVIVERAEVNGKSILKTRIRLIEDGTPQKLWTSQEGTYFAMKEVRQIDFSGTRFDQQDD